MTTEIKMKKITLKTLKKPKVEGLSSSVDDDKSVSTVSTMETKTSDVSEDSIKSEKKEEYKYPDGPTKITYCRPQGTRPSNETIRLMKSMGMRAYMLKPEYFQPKPADWDEKCKLYIDTINDAINDLWVLYPYMSEYISSRSSLNMSKNNKYFMAKKGKLIEVDGLDYSVNVIEIDTSIGKIRMQLDLEIKDCRAIAYVKSALDDVFDELAYSKIRDDYDMMKDESWKRRPEGKRVKMLTDVIKSHDLTLAKCAEIREKVKKIYDDNAHHIKSEIEGEDNMIRQLLMKIYTMNYCYKHYKTYLARQSLIKATMKQLSKIRIDDHHYGGVSLYTIPYDGDFRITEYETHMEILKWYDFVNHTSKFCEFKSRMIYHVREDKKSDRGKWRLSIHVNKEDYMNIDVDDEQESA